VRIDNETAILQSGPSKIYSHWKPDVTSALQTLCWSGSGAGFYSPACHRGCFSFDPRLVREVYVCVCVSVVVGGCGCVDVCVCGCVWVGV